MDHATIKLLHMACVALSLTGFGARALLMLMNSSFLYHPLVKRGPHYIDTLLLVTGIMLAVNLRQYPFTAPWLTAKLFALLAYIVLGSLALRGKTKQIRIAALIGALVAAAYLVSVALTRSPLAWY